MTYVFRTLVFCSMVFSQATLWAATSDEAETMHGAPEPKIFRTRQASRPLASSPQLSYHDGPVIHSARTYVIFWGHEWNNSSFAGDKITGLDRFFGGFGGSRYANTSTEYSDSSGAITSNAAYQGHVMDVSAAPQRAAKTSQIIAEACKMSSNNPDPDGVYFVYTSTKAGNVNYCAWHSWGNCSNGAKIQVAYMPNLDGIVGCDPQDNASGNSQGLAALANVTGHELVEAITDPRGSAWYDSSGQENADKCAWSFPPGDGLSTLYDGSKFKIQMTWSNSAFIGATGLANRSGQLGCVY
jgi:hypothetical protein